MSQRPAILPLSVEYLLPTQYLGLIMLDKSHTNLVPCACYSCLYPDYNWKKIWLIIPLTHWTTTAFFSIADEHHYFSPETVKSLWETSTKLIIILRSYEIDLGVNNLTISGNLWQHSFFPVNKGHLAIHFFNLSNFFRDISLIQKMSRKGCRYNVFIKKPLVSLVTTVYSIHCFQNLSSLLDLR